MKTLPNKGLNKLRVFFAIPLTDVEREDLRQSLLHSGVVLPGQVVNPLSWHITLFFVGEIEEVAVEKLIHNLQEHVWCEKFEFILNKFDAFPSAGHAKVLWCGSSKENAELHELVSILSHQLLTMGYPSDPRDFSGHLTLSYLSPERDLSEFVKSNLHSVKLQVSRFALYRSLPELGPQHYEELANFKLQEPSVV